MFSLVNFYKTFLNILNFKFIHIFLLFNFYIIQINLDTNINIL